MLTHIQHIFPRIQHPQHISRETNIARYIHLPDTLNLNFPYIRLLDTDHTNSTLTSHKSPYTNNTHTHTQHIHCIKQKSSIYLSFLLSLAFILAICICALIFLSAFIFKITPLSFATYCLNMKFSSTAL